MTNREHSPVPPPFQAKGGGLYRARRAHVGDVQDIFRLTNGMAEKGLMLPRSKYKIITMLSSFYVAVDAESEAVVAAGSLSPLWTDLAEICALAVDEGAQGRGLGRFLVECLIAEGRRMEFPRIITLTYQVEFFSKLGFHIEDKDAFPRKVWRECLECPKLECCDETAMYLNL